MSSSTALATFTERFLTEYSDVHPTYAAYLGFHEYDGRVPDLSQEAIEGRIVYLQDALDEVNSIDADRLDGVEWLDYQLLRDAIKSSCSTWGGSAAGSAIPRPIFGRWKWTSTSKEWLTAMKEGPARAEAVRGTIDAQYLNFTLGRLMLLKLRDDYRPEQGDTLDLKTFHDAFLAWGGPPVPYIRRLILQHDDGGIL